MRGGPNDLRLGVSTLAQKCETCGETKDCQGHFGYIKLNEPVFHYGYLKYIEKILKCVCHNCSKMKVLKSEDQIEKYKIISRIKNPSRRLT